MGRAGNFPKSVKREALARSGNKCEAVGTIYGLQAGERCNADLAKGVEFDHFDLVANSADSSLSNCRAVCIQCHRHKTAKHDVPKAAKTQRQQDKGRGIRARPKQEIKSRGFGKKERAAKLGLPPRFIYRSADNG